MQQLTTLPAIRRYAGGDGGLLRFHEPSSKLNEHTRDRVRRELKPIAEALKLHGYPIYKLSGREVWRIGSALDCYLLSYQFDPLLWVLFPHNGNIHNIITTFRLTS